MSRLFLSLSLSLSRSRPSTVHRRVEAREPASGGDGAPKGQGGDRHGTKTAATRAKRAREAKEAVDGAARAAARSEDAAAVKAAQAGLKRALKKLRATRGDATSASEVLGAAGRARGLGGLGVPRSDAAAFSAVDGAAPSSPRRVLGRRIASGCASIASPACGAAASYSPRAPRGDDGDDGASASTWRPKRTYVAALQQGGLGRALRTIQAPRRAAAAAEPTRKPTVLTTVGSLRGELKADGTVRVTRRAADVESDDDDSVGPLLAIPPVGGDGAHSDSDSEAAFGARAARHRDAGARGW